MTQSSPVISPFAIRALLHAAERSTGSPNPTVLAALSRGDALPSYRVESWLCSTGCFGLWVNDALLADWPTDDVFPRPRRASVMGGDGTTAPHFVAYLLKLHRLGIDAGARAAVEALRPTLAKREFLTAAELKVWWAPKELDRFEDPLVIQTAAPWPDAITVAGRSGHSVTVAPNREGLAVVIGHGARPSRRKLEDHFLRAGALSALAVHRRQ